MKVIVAGSRGFNDYELLKKKLDHVLSKRSVVEIISGTARGVDQLGERYAKEKDFPCSRYPADWNTHGKSAGYLRNVQMADIADALVAFWDEHSPGTKHMIDIAKRKGLVVRVYNASGKIIGN